MKKSVIFMWSCGMFLLILCLVAKVSSQETKTSSNDPKEVCANNLKLIGQALMLYCEDNGGYFPPPTRWPALLFPKYLKEYSALSCPSADKETPTHTLMLANGKRFSGHYGMNSELNDPVSVSKGWITMPNIKTMKNKEIIPAIMDIKGPHILFAPWTVCNDDGTKPTSMSPRHDNGCNMLWTDGHVSWLSWEKYIQLGSQRNGWEWLTNWK
ncbi:MAG: hypothetical protein N2115_02220 [bacterium]|nr:hypothetical protein [bacterium]